MLRAATALAVCLAGSVGLGCPDPPRGRPELPPDTTTSEAPDGDADGSASVVPEVLDETEAGPEDDPDIEVMVGECTPGAVDPACDDDNPCTDDLCGASAECLHIPNIALCDDGDGCTTFDRCNGGACAGSARACDDGEACTADRCEAGACVHDPVSGPCDDGDPCTADDHCAGGACAGSAVVCPGAGPCAEARCTPRVGCEVVPRAEGADCDDGDACTELTRCADGVCRGALVTCDDADPCSDDYCDPRAGCLHRDNRAPCDDGDRCTRNDRCEAGVCAGAATETCCSDDAACDDGDPCTDDLCAGPDCVHPARSCDDGDPCTRDRCEGGACISAPWTALPPEGQIIEDFEGGDDLAGWALTTTNEAVGWRLSASWAASGARSLYCGDAAGDGYDHGATVARASMRVLVPVGEPALHLSFKRDVGDGPSCVYDVLRVLGDDRELARVCVNGEGTERVSLADFEGREVTLAFELDTVDGMANHGAGVWIDRLAVTADGCR